MSKNRPQFGPNPQLMKWAYTGVVRPKLTYGCHMWSHKINKTLKAKLQRLNRLACLSIAPVKRSSPTAGLEVIYNIMPLDIHVQKVATSIFIRIQKQIHPSWDGIGNKLGKLGHLKTCLKTAEKLNIIGIPNDKIVECKSWDPGFRILDFTEHKHDASEDASKLYCYTDGSKINNGSGCGYQTRMNNNPEPDYQEYLGTQATVFQAEIVALSRAASHLSIRHNQNITFRVDSQSAILAIKSNNISSALVKECVDNLNGVLRKKAQWEKGTTGKMQKGKRHK